MSLSAAPTFTPGSPGNLVSSQTCTNGTPVTATFAIGVSSDSGVQGSLTTGAALSGRVQVWSKGGTAVASTNGCLVQVFSTSDGTNYDTVPFSGVSFVIASAISTQAYQSFELPHRPVQALALEPGHNQRDHGGSHPGHNGLSPLPVGRCRLLEHPLHFAANGSLLIPGVPPRPSTHRRSETTNN